MICFSVSFSWCKATFQSNSQLYKFQFHPHSYTNKVENKIKFISELIDINIWIVNLYDFMIWTEGG